MAGTLKEAVCAMLASALFATRESAKLVGTLPATGKLQANVADAYGKLLREAERKASQRPGTKRGPKLRRVFLA